MGILERLEIHEWAGPFDADTTARAVAALEAGKMLYAPGLRFELNAEEQRFLDPAYLNGKSKNISFNAATGEVGGTSAEGSRRDALADMMRRFADESSSAMAALCPDYAGRLEPGLTSFRPAEIEGRESSWRKDDTRLHVDAFPSRPNQGKRILRFFTNVNPAQARIWRAGEPFEDAARTLLARVQAPLPGVLPLLPLLRITKGRRTLYDHYMLGLHDAMKADAKYQAEVQQTEIAFPPGSAWACFTDAVSHAAMAGQHAFEQTFYLPVEAMRDPRRSPLRILEQQLGRALV